MRLLLLVGKSSAVPLRRTPAVNAVQPIHIKTPTTRSRSIVRVTAAILAFDALLSGSLTAADLSLTSVGTASWQDGARNAFSTEKLMIQLGTNPVTGQVGWHTNRYLQVATGENYLDAAGQWRPSEDKIELMSDGTAAALHGPIRVWFSPNLNTSNAITVMTASNRVFQTDVAGLYFYDAASGQRQLISGLRDCQAELVSPNQIVYKSAFQKIQADVRITYTKSGLESDLILLQCPKSPTSYGFSSESSVRLELWHEFYGCPPPQV